MRRSGVRPPSAPPAFTALRPGWHATRQSATRQRTTAADRSLPTVAARCPAEVGRTNLTRVPGNRQTPMNPTEAAPDSILRHRPFVFYWSARTCSSLAFQVLGVAVGWQMYALTGSAFDLGLVGLTQFLPAAAFMLVAGQIADRYDRRRLLQIWQLVEALAAAALALGSISGWVSKAFILAAVFVFGVGRAFDSPTQQTLLPGVVPASLFPRAVAASASTTQLATISCPPVGGALYLLGPAVPYAACCTLFLASVVLLAFVQTERLVAKRTPINLTAFFAG